MNENANEEYIRVPAGDDDHDTSIIIIAGLSVIMSMCLGVFIFVALSITGVI